MSVTLGVLEESRSVAVQLEKNSVARGEQRFVGEFGVTEERNAEVGQGLRT